MKTEENNKEKFTPAPWHVIEFAGYFNIHNEPFYEANNILDAEHVGYELAKRNARLAAASPTLYEALKGLVSIVSYACDIETDSKEEQYMRAQLDKAKAALSLVDQQS